MAKQVSEVLIKLGIEGDQELSKLKSSFNELSKVTKLSETDLGNLRSRLFDFGREAGNTERVNKGLTDALRGMLNEAARGSTIWQQLNTDIAQLRREARLTDSELTSLRNIIVDEAKSHKQSASSIRDHIKSLQDLRNQASLNSKLHQQLSADIQTLTNTLDQSTVGNRKHYSSLTQILAVKPDAVLKQWQAYNKVLQEGTASADKLAVAQRRLQQLSGAPRILERRRIAETAAITQDPEYLSRFGFAGRSLPELPNTNAAYAQQIKELQQDLANLDRTSVAYLQTLMQLTGIQRQATAVAQGYAQSLLMGINTGTVEGSSRNLQEVITALRAEMQQLDVTTAEGSAAYANNANQVRNLERELNNLANSYRHVGDMAAQAAVAQASVASRSVIANYLNRPLVRQQEAAAQDLAQRIQQGIGATPLMLPAAGQTSAPGTGLAYSGGARVGRATGAIQQIFAPGSGVGGVRFPGEAERLQPTASAEVSDRARRAYLSEIEASRAAAAQAEATAQRMTNLRAAVDKASQANTGSIKSLNELRSKITALREELAPTSAEFKKYTKDLSNVDTQLSRIERTAGRRLTLGQGVQAAGAIISGGIFGGPEGLAGGLLGAGVGLALPTLGPVGGAFAGSAIGGQLGMFRQQLGAATELSSELARQRTALQGVVSSYSDYLNAIQATENISKRFNIPLTDATTQFTRLSAAVVGSGRSLKDSEFALKAVTQAIKGTGGGAEQVQGTLLALTQVFSKGKVTAEELNQIAERLPGTYTTFAQAVGKSDLSKALQEGKVSIEDLMKFLELLSKKYAKTADDIAKSSQDAGARFTKAFQDLQLTAGSALQGIGADFQNFGTRVVRSLDRVMRKMIELGLIKPGAQYYVAEVESKRMSIGQLEQRLLEAGSRSMEGRGVNPLLRKILYPEAAAAESEAQIYERALKEIRKGQALATKPGGLPPLPGGVGETPEQKRAREQREKDAQVAAEQQQRYDEAVIQNQIRLADKFFDHATELDRRRYELQKELDDLRNENQLRGLQGIDKEVTAAFVKYTQRLTEINQRVAVATVAVQEAQQQQTAAALIEQVTSSGLQGRYRQGGYGPSGPRTYGAHFDIKRVGGGYFDRAALDRYVEVNGRPLSAGVTVPGGEYYARRAGRPYHGGWDYQFGGDTTAATLGLRGGARWMSTRPGSYGAEAVFMTPDGKTYKIIHGTFEPAGQASSGGRQRAAVAAQGLRAVREGVDLQLAGLDVQQRQRLAGMETAQAEKLRLEARIGFTHDLTEALTQQNYQLNEESILLKERTRLEKLGVSNEYLEKQLKLFDIERRRSQYTERITALIKEAASPTERMLLTDNLAAINALLTDQANLLDRIYKLNESNKQGFGFREGAKQYVESIGSMKEATAQLTVNGIKGLEDALMDLATTGTANFGAFAAEILKQTARIILQQLVLKPLIQGLANLFNPAAAVNPTAAGGDLWGAVGRALAPAGSANGNAFAANGIVPYAMGGIVDKPTLFRFANGGVPSTGLMGEAGPEAIIPLSRGRNGKLGVAGGGGTTNIVVNVDAKGSSVEGDDARSAALGRVVTAAVQAELIKQKRPGGILSR